MTNSEGPRDVGQGLERLLDDQANLARPPSPALRSSRREAPRAYAPGRIYRRLFLPASRQCEASTPVGQRSGIRGRRHDRATVRARSSLRSEAFGGITALQSVDVDFHAAEVHALLGENFAGKSTLIKILAGVHRQDGGEVLWRGKPEDPARERLPIVFIHQDLGLVEEMTVAENIGLVAGYPMRRGGIDWKTVDRDKGVYFRPSDRQLRQIAERRFPRRSIARSP